MNDLTFLFNKLKEEYPYNYEEIIKGYDIKRKSSFRINKIKTNNEEIDRILKEKNINFQKVSWYNDAYIVDNIELIKNLDIYKNGMIYVQSLSSMIPVLILNPKNTDHIFDMTAAPGSKTTQIASITNNEASIMACEKNRIRKDRLIYNINLQEAKRITVLNEDSRNIDELFRFNKILLDAPCSGSGTISFNNINNKQYINKQNLDKICKIQYELLEKAIKLLNIGDELVYSTCSILKEENEEIINKFLIKKEVELIPIDFKNIPILPTSIEGTLCICPNEEFEGFFVAKLKKIN